MRAKHVFVFYQQQNLVQILCASKIHIVGSAFWTCICSFLMILFLPKYMINVKILTLNCQFSF